MVDVEVVWSSRLARCRILCMRSAEEGGCEKLLPRASSSDPANGAMPVPATSPARGMDATADVDDDDDDEEEGMDRAPKGDCTPQQSIRESVCVCVCGASRARVRTCFFPKFRMVPSFSLA
jgi:hypothetical protein